MSLDEKSRLKLEKVFFLYGSTSKTVQPVRPDEWGALAEDMWSWAIIKVSALMDELTDSLPEPPPVETPRQENEQAKKSNVKTKAIMVHTIKPVKSGTNENGGKWTLTRITDTDNMSFVTFAGSRYVVDGKYVIDYTEEKRGQFINRTIQEPKEREPGEDDEIPF